MISIKYALSSQVPNLQFNSFTTRGTVLQDPKAASVALFPVPNWP